jgi:hypothetical protein
MNRSAFSSLVSKGGKTMTYGKGKKKPMKKVASKKMASKKKTMKKKKSSYA